MMRFVDAALFPPWELWFGCWIAVFLVEFALFSWLCLCVSSGFCRLFSGVPILLGTRSWILFSISLALQLEPNTRRSVCFCSWNGLTVCSMLIGFSSFLGGGDEVKLFSRTPVFFPQIGSWPSCLHMVVRFSSSEVFRPISFQAIYWHPFAMTLPFSFMKSSVVLSCDAYIQFPLIRICMGFLWKQCKEWRWVKLC